MNAKVLKTNVQSVCGECASIHANPESAAPTKSMYARSMFAYTLHTCPAHLPCTHAIAAKWNCTCIPHECWTHVASFLAGWAFKSLGIV